MTSRFLIAAVAGYVILAIVFLIDNTLPDQQEANPNPTLTQP